MSLITYAQRTYGREQFTATLACLSALNDPDFIGKIVLAIDTTPGLSPTQESMAGFMQQRGWRFEKRGSDGLGAGPAMLAMMRGVYDVADTPFVLFFDDDILFNQDHLRRMIKETSEHGAATFIQTDLDPFFADHHYQFSIQCPMHDPYMTMIRSDLLFHIPFYLWLPLGDVVGVTDLLFFNKVLEFNAIPANVLRDGDRPDHLFVHNPARKPWGDLDMGLYDQYCRDFCALDTYKAVCDEIPILNRKLGWK